MVRSVSSFKNVWVEISKSEHHHGGPGWEFGTCLWSPSRDIALVDRYSIMRSPVRGDLVLHFYHNSWPDGEQENRLCGNSIVEHPFKEVTVEPPFAGDWSGRSSYYRIDLKDYPEYPNPVSFSAIRQHYGLDIRRDMQEGRPLYYPFNTYGDTIRTVQGIYLAICTAGLYRILMTALGLEAAGADAGGSPEIHAEYGEGARTFYEGYFFTRNPALSKKIKEINKFICQACGFDYERKYGELGKGYIECHHLNPLSEQPEDIWTDGVKSTLEDVTTLCANCHRMIHRRRPALALVELITLIGPPT